jgi:hypothetical protein
MFKTALGANNVDRITDFSVPGDTIRIDNAVFLGLASGALSAAALARNTSGFAGDSSDRIIYETDTGALFFDPRWHRGHLWPGPVRHRGHGPRPHRVRLRGDVTASIAVTGEPGRPGFPTLRRGRAGAGARA